LMSLVGSELCIRASGMVLQIFFVPALFIIFQKIHEKISPLKWKDTDNEGINSEIEQYSR
ncbi:MAG: hypothetical protein K2I25_02480, partial [Muribaculaceae bacterium]|nr:hypothetical protein [Muribaculaceae bacterium]